MRNRMGYVNYDEMRFEAMMKEREMRNTRLQSLAILQVRAELMETIQNRWEWFETLPSEFKDNPLFVENLKDEPRQEAAQMIYKQQEMGMDKAHLQMLEEMLTIS